MTIRDYISAILRPLGIGEAQFADIEMSLKDCLPDDDYTPENQRDVAVAMTQCVASMMLAPRMESVNEGGFSMAWNFADLSKWYLHMCRKWRLEPDEALDGLLGVSKISDRTSAW